MEKTGINSTVNLRKASKPQRETILKRNARLAELGRKEKRKGLRVKAPYDRIRDPEEIIIDKHSLSRL